MMDLLVGGLFKVLGIGLTIFLTLVAIVAILYFVTYTVAFIFLAS